MTLFKDQNNNNMVGWTDQVTGQTLTENRQLDATLGSVNAEAIADLSGQAALAIDIRGTFVGTMSFEATVGGTNYFAIPAIAQATGAYVTTATAAGVWLARCAGFRRIRVRCSAYTSGAAIVSIRCSQGGHLVLTENLPVSLIVTATGVTGAAVTLTIPAGGAGLFHYIGNIRVQRHTSALLTAGATPLIVTTTNLPGSLAMSFPADAAPQGQVSDQVFEPTQLLKSSVANTATTIVCPATTGVIWRATTMYRLGA